MALENSRETSNKDTALEETVFELKFDLNVALEEKKSIEKKLRQAKEKDGWLNLNKHSQLNKLTVIFQRSNS
jgi:hypothetical protein